MLNSKILITAPKLDLGGVSSFVKSILPYLGNDAVVYRRGKSLKQDKHVSMVQNLLLPIDFIWFILFKSKADNFIINTSLSLFCLLRDGVMVLIAKLFRKKVLLMIHGFNASVLKHRLLLNIGFFKSDCIIVLSNEFKSKLLLAGYKKNIYTQYNPVDHNILASTAPKRDFTKINDILFMSRIEREKGVYILLDFFKDINKLYPHVSLHIAGNGSEFANMMNYITENSIDNVIVHGFVSGNEKIKLLYNTDALIFPSYYAEGLPISVLEAMAAGQLILTRPVAGLVDLYSATNFGASIDSLDSKHFVDIFVDMVENREKLSAVRIKNYQFARDNFCPQIIACKMVKIFNNV